MSRPGFSEFVSVFTLASTAQSSERFFPVPGTARSAREVAAILASIELYCSTGDLRVVPALQKANELDSWPAANVFTVVGDAVATADGVIAGTGYTAMSLEKAYYRPGVVVRNNSAGQPKTEFGLVAVRFVTRGF